MNPKTLPCLLHPGELLDGASCSGKDGTSLTRAHLHRGASTPRHSALLSPFHSPHTKETSAKTFSFHLSTYK